jgi:hypothetical protein
MEIILETEEQRMTTPIADCTTPPPNKPMSVALARALAEAADGFPGQAEPIYLVAPYLPLDDPNRGGFRIFGPYRSWEKVPPGLQREVCVGNAGFFGPFDTRLAPTPAGRAVTRIDLHVEETTDVYPIPADRLDALFFTSQAVEKFALPYYERLFGPEFGAHVIRQFLNANVQVMAHFPWSEYSDGTGLLRVAHTPFFVAAASANSPLVALVPGAEGGTVLQAASPPG